MGADPSSPAAVAAIEVIVEADAWEKAGVDWEALVANLHARARNHMPDAAPDGLALAVLLADDARLRELNRGFRGKDAPTNVLSFPAPPRTGALGDVAVAFETCAREAEQQGKTFRDHAAHLILHGVLHLYGFDHEAGEEEAERMEAVERAVLAEIGVEDPYQERRATDA